MYYHAMLISLVKICTNVFREKMDIGLVMTCQTATMQHYIWRYI